MALVRRLAPQRQARLNLRMAQVLGRLKQVAGGDLGLLAGEHQERLDWPDATSATLPSTGAVLSPVWTVFFDGAKVSGLMPQLLLWCRAAQLDVYDPQLQVYFAWQDPDGLDKIAHPLAPEFAAGADTPSPALPPVPVPVRVWASKIARIPADAADAAGLLEQLAGQTLRGRRFYQAVGQALWSEVALAMPHLRAALQAFEADPCDWGANLDEPCPAVWSLAVSAAAWPTVWPLLCRVAQQRQLCIYIPTPQPVWWAPGLPLPPALPPEVSAQPQPGPTAAAPLQPAPSQAVAAASAPDDAITPVMNALSGALTGMGFDRQRRAVFERAWSSGTLGLLVELDFLSEIETGVRVYLAVRLPATKRALLQVVQGGGLQPGDVPAIEWSFVADLLHHRRLTTAGGARGGHGDCHFTFRHASELPARCEQDVLPAVRQLLADPVPWFLDPPDLLASLKRAVAGGGFPAGLRPIHMEDLVLAHLSDDPDREAYLAQRIAMAGERCPITHDTPASLRRMAAALAARVPVDPVLAAPRTRPVAKATPPGPSFPGPVAGASPLARAGWGLALGPLVGLLALGMGAPDPVLPAAILLSLLWTATQLYQVGRPTVWRWVLPWTVIVPPLALLAILVLAWRRRRHP